MAREPIETGWVGELLRELRPLRKRRREVRVRDEDRVARGGEHSLPDRGALPLISGVDEKRQRHPGGLGRPPCGVSCPVGRAVVDQDDLPVEAARPARAPGRDVAHAPFDAVDLVVGRNDERGCQAHTRNFWAIGYRLPSPKDLAVIFGPGAAWRRLYSLPSIRRAMSRASSQGRLRAARGSGGRQRLVDEGLDQGVEHGVLGQRVRVLLVRLQLRRRRLRERGLRDHRPVAVDVPRESVDEHLRDVRDEGVTAGHVAVEGAVPDGQLRLVAGREHEVAEGVREGHQDGAADAGLDVLLGGLPPFAELAAERLAVGLEDLADRDDPARDAEIPGELLGVRDAPGRGVGPGHGDARDAPGAEGLDRERGRDRGVDPAREAEHGARKSALAGVVLESQDERAAHLGDRREVAVDRVRARPASRSTTGLPRTPRRGRRAGRARRRRRIARRRRGCRCRRRGCSPGAARPCAGRRRSSCAGGAVSCRACTVRPRC